MPRFAPAAPRRTWLLVGAAVVVACAATLAWRLSRGQTPAAAFAVGNGRLEAQEVHVATKLPGRIAEVLVDEGDAVAAGQMLARMDTASLAAQLAQARAQVNEARSRRAAGAAGADQRMSECRLSERELGRTRALHERDFASERDLDVSRERTTVAHAACSAAQAEVGSLEAAIEAAQAQVARIETDLRDSALVSPVSGRVQHRLAEPGEVLAAGGRVLTLLDLGDVYMTLFLPAEDAVRVALGAEARVVLDATPELALPARVTFVSAETQFTPKHVETRSEREKLSFRVKAQVIDGHDPALKPGAPGVAWIRLDDRAAWPEPKP